MEAVIYNQTGKEAGKLKLPENLFGLPKNETLVHQVVTAMMGNARQSSAHTKNRGEVSGTGKKPWRQKGTGRARHGSRRSPIWVGGGISHGPRNDKNYERKVNKKMRAKALFTVLSEKLRGNQVLFVDSIAPKDSKTREAKKIISSLKSIKGFEKLENKKNACFIALNEMEEATVKGFRNFGNVEVGLAKDINPMDVLSYKYVIFANPEETIKTLSARA